MNLQEGNVKPDAFGRQWRGGGGGIAGMVMVKEYTNKSSLEVQVAFKAIFVEDLIVINKSKSK